MSSVSMLTEYVLLFLGLVVLGACGHANRVSRQTEPPADNLTLVVFTMGTDDGSDDPTTEWFTGVPAHEMITVVRIEYFEQEGIKHVRCVGFTYADKENNCPEEPENSAHDVVDFVLENDEFINFVSGDVLHSLMSIYFETNKGNNIGPFGTETDPAKHKYQFSHDVDAPLIYVEGYKGMWVYSLRFSFYYVNVLNLENITNEVAHRTYTALQTTIDDIELINSDYKRMLPDIARKGCAYFDDEQSLESEIACDLETILDQVNILATASVALQNHSPRNLLTLKDYDSEKYLDEVQDAKQFHDLLTQIQFGLNTVINVTMQQSNELKEFFVASAEFDKEIAEKDLAYIQQQLDSKEQGSAEVTELVGRRLTSILSVGISMAAMDVIQEAVEFALVLASNLNPLKWIFGGPDIDAIMEALEDLMNAVGDLIQLAVLMSHLEEFVGHAYEITAEFAENQEAIDAMTELVEVLSEEDDPEIIAMYADEYLKSYGDYTPTVTSQDITYTITLLDAMAEESCSLIGDIESANPMIIAAHQLALDDCTFVSADIAVLGSYFEDIYTLQFEMIDCLTSIVRGEIAIAMAERIGSIETTIDIRTMAIGAAMVETAYQGASLARCDILEYLDAAKRPEICELLLFKDEDIQKLIAYRGSLASSYREEFAYMPTSPNGDILIPYINITNLLRGEYQKIKLPIENEQWLKDYGWLPSSYDPETAFYYYSLEMYLPGLKCNETEEKFHTVNVESLSSNPTYLYSQEAPPKFTVDKHLIKFEYREPGDDCAGSRRTFPVLDSETLNKKDEKEVCIVSAGDIDVDPKPDFTYPSLYTTWTFSLTGHHQCTLVDYLDDLDYLPLITFRYKMIETMVRKDPDDPGIDECWPAETRCPAGERCKDLLLDYCCQDSQENCD